MSIYHFARDDRRPGLGSFTARHRSTLYKGIATNARRATHRIDGFLHRMIEALAASKMRRLERELQLRGVTYARTADRSFDRNK